MPSSGFLKDSDSSFSNKLLIAMPGLQDGFFNKSVIYLCAHSAAGAMGIVINQPLPEVGFRDLLKQLHLPQSELRVEPVVHYGGPVETGRGFVLHSTDFIREDTVQINDHICVTGTIDIIQAMAEGKGPHKSIFALGYAGWGPGQLESEIQQNSWLTVTPDEELLFNTSLPKKWERALKKLGVDLATLSIEAGHA
jgi:putative transcriptional regulator